MEVRTHSLQSKDLASMSKIVEGFDSMPMMTGTLPSLATLRAWRGYGW